MHVQLLYAKPENIGSCPPPPLNKPPPPILAHTQLRTSLCNYTERDRCYQSPPHSRFHVPSLFDGAAVVTLQLVDSVIDDVHHLSIDLAASRCIC